MWECDMPRLPTRRDFSGFLMAAAFGKVAPASVSAPGPVGWASVGQGTTGGAGGPVVTVTDAAAFAKAAKGEKPAVVRVEGQLRLPDSARIGSNKTIMGARPGAGITGAGLNVRQSSNVIISRLVIRGAKPDGISVEEGSSHVWVDHCDLSECADGLLDIKRGSDLITISWCRFHHHHKTTLVGHSDSDEARKSDLGKLRVTYHHNLFDGTISRHPRVRFAETVHVFNNHFKSVPHGVHSSMDAGVLVEGNYFEKVDYPTHTVFGKSPRPGRLVERDNIYSDCGHKPDVAGMVKEPSLSYHYSLDKAALIPEILKGRAGVTG